MDATLGEDMDEWLWPESCAELRQIESSLRCLICGDFFHGPVLLPCTHTFCSECVRRFLQSRSNNGCCPECKQPCSASDLVPNRSLEKIGLLFQQMKPKILPVLDKSKANQFRENASPSKPALERLSADSKPPDRMTLLSYSVMKEKDIKKLLESIGIRAPIKNRDDIIQIHKEYVLLANAQADSIHPKSAKQIREEVMRNYRARQGEKASNFGARKSLDGAQSPVITAEMQAGFERLRQQVKARTSQQRARQEENEGNNSDQVDDQKHADTPRAEGIWRHVHAVQSNLDFYVHSTTYEIRLQPPKEFSERQEQLKQNAQNDASSSSLCGEARKSPASQVEVTTIASDDDDDFTVVTSPAPRPPSASLHSTPQSQRKRDNRRRSSVGSASSGVVTAFFSQETSCSLQDTYTQNAPSASLSMTSSLSGDHIDLANDDDADGDGKWDCHRCTLVNEASAADCEACGNPRRPTRKKQKLHFQSKIYPSQS